MSGDWGLGIGDWAQSPIPNPQSPIPNPQSPFYIYQLNKNIIYHIYNKKEKIFIVIHNFLALFYNSGNFHLK